MAASEQPAQDQTSLQPTVIDPLAPKGQQEISGEAPPSPTDKLQTILRRASREPADATTAERVETASATRASEQKAQDEAYKAEMDAAPNSEFKTDLSDQIRARVLDAVEMRRVLDGRASFGVIDMRRIDKMTAILAGEQD